ncbi:MAG: hypothetical protein AAGD43_34300 [Pseudomonadota bacterium]
MSDQFELQLIEDVFEAGGKLAFPDDGINRIAYVVHGGLKVGADSFSDDQSWHGKGPSEVNAASTGATVWRFELAPVLSNPTMLAKPHGTSHVKLRYQVALPADEILMRNDSVSFPPGGCAYLHTHQGPGIRCLIDGGIRIDAEGHSTSFGPGGAWFEAGPDPVFAQAAADRPSRFIRAMILPASYLGKSSITYVNAEDLDKPKSQVYKSYVDTPITL